MTRILRMRGLPFSATEADIAAFFAAWGLEDVRICKKSGRPTGEAYVKFKTEKGCVEAMSTKDKEKLGKRYVELFKAKDQDLEQRPSEPDVISKGHVVRMRGLPFSACVADIVLFFADIPSVDQDNILFVYDSSGRPSGEAYVYFTEEEGCRRALRMDKKEMGSRYIELFPTHDSDIQRASRLGRLRSGKSENHPPRRHRAPAKAAAPTASKPAKPSETAVSAPKAIPNYKPVAVKQLTKTFANVAAASLTSSEQNDLDHGSARVGSGFGGSSGFTASSILGGSSDGETQLVGFHARDSGGSGGPDAIAAKVEEKLALADSSASSLFASTPPGGGEAVGNGIHVKSNGVKGSARPESDGRAACGPTKQSPVWQQWGEGSACGVSGLPVYDMWSHTVLPKVAATAHAQLSGSFQSGLWQPSVNHNTGVGASAFSHGSLDPLVGAHRPVVEPPIFQNR